MDWPTGMAVESPRNAVALETALTHICITYDTAPRVRSKEHSFMNALHPFQWKAFKHNLADVQAMLDQQPERVREAFLGAYFAHLITK